MNELIRKEFERVDQRIDTANATIKANSKDIKDMGKKVDKNSTANEVQNTLLAGISEDISGIRDDFKGAVKWLLGGFIFVIVMLVGFAVWAIQYSIVR